MQTTANRVREPSPLVISAEQARQTIEDEQDRPLVIDLGKPEVYAQAHIAGALSFAYGDLVSGEKPAAGLPPSVAALTQLLHAYGVNHTRRIIVYDDELGSKSARFAWTLHYLGQQAVSVIDGGLHAWINAGFGITARPADLTDVTAAPAFEVNVNYQVLAQFNDVLSAIDDPATRILDARSAAEYAGSDVRAKHGGHIPGAINVDWQHTIDFENNRRLLPRAVLLEMLAERDITPAQRVIVYCQTHHRSSHSYVMLRHLGFDKVSGYAGSWSEWGNRDDAPVESDS